VRIEEARRDRGPGHLVVGYHVGDERIPAAGAGGEGVALSAWRLRVGRIGVEGRPRGLTVACCVYASAPLEDRSHRKRE